MYYPFLRTKQFELKALREFAESYIGQSSIVPILDPVKQQLNPLATAISTMMQNDMRFALILNPSNGDFKHATVHFDVLNGTMPLLTESIEKWIPAFTYKKTAVNDIRSLMTENNLQQVMIVFMSCVDIEDDVAMELIKDNRVAYVVNSFGTTTSRRVKNALLGTGKQVIRLDDCFKARTTNSDYIADDDEFFSEEIFYYKSEERFHGFSDYTALPSEYIEGGMLPKALAIHFTYQKNEDQLYVHHFVSDSNESRSDIQGKFREAARKVEPFFADKKHTSAIDETIERANASDGYPGLGYLKKLSIKNHLELVHSILNK